MKINADVFLDTLTPILKSGDVTTLAETVSARWDQVLICQFLAHPEGDVRRVAALTIGLVGDRSALPSLTRALRDVDSQVNEMAENSLWTIWFRGSNARAVRPFKEGVALLAIEAYDRAIASFSRATVLDPNFAEAFNQCAIAHFFLKQWKASLTACRRTIHLIPTHFGAISGMGHCYTQMGDLGRALKCYKRAVKINPRMDVVKHAISRLEQRILDHNDISGEFIVGHQSS